MLGSVTGDELLRMLPSLREWWVARDADDALLAAHPHICLAYYVDASPGELDGALDATRLCGRGINAGKRTEALGPHCVEQHKLLGQGGKRYNLLWLGSETPDWTVQVQLDGAAGGERPARVRGRPDSPWWALREGEAKRRRLDE